jgi:PhnB protein
MVRNAELTPKFLGSVFNAERLRVHDREDGPGIAHAEARIDDTIIMMGEVPEANVAHIHVYVREAEKTFAKAVAEGGKVVQELKRSGDGDHRGGVADGNGIVWWISTQEDYQE